MPTPHIQTFILGDYQTNCFVVTVPDSPSNKDDCWIVDCGFQPQAMFDYIEAKKLKPTRLLLTHAHCDHIAGVDAALARLGPVPLAIHDAEKDFCSNPMLNLSAMIGPPITCSEPEKCLHDGDSLNFNGTTWRVVHAPGHSPGCALFIHDKSKQAIVGDTLFAGSIGRIDFPTSDPDAMRNTIANVMMSLPDDLTIHPGHGPKTTIGRERKTNPFVVQGF